MNKYVHIATIYDRAGKILSRAVNNYTRSHPIQARFAGEAGQPERIFLHAEIAALVKLRGNQKPTRIHIERYTKDGKPANSAPCPVCQAALKHWKIKYVTYTTTIKD